MRFHITAACIKCGACAEDCPVGIIRRGDSQFHIGPGCIGCGDCYTICPVGAIEMDVPSCDIIEGVTTKNNVTER